MCFLLHRFEHLDLRTTERTLFLVEELELELVLGLDLACLELLLFVVLHGLSDYFLDLVEVLETATF